MVMEIIKQENKTDSDSEWRTVMSSYGRWSFPLKGTFVMMASRGS